jgi:hypothetical protein
LAHGGLITTLNTNGAEQNVSAVRKLRQSNGRQFNEPPLSGPFLLLGLAPSLFLLQRHSVRLSHTDQELCLDNVSLPEPFSSSLFPDAETVVLPARKWAAAMSRRGRRRHPRGLLDLVSHRQPAPLVLWTASASHLRGFSTRCCSVPTRSRSTVRQLTHLPLIVDNTLVDFPLRWLHIHTISLKLLRGTLLLPSDEYCMSSSRECPASSIFRVHSSFQHARACKTRSWTCR